MEVFKKEVEGFQPLTFFYQKLQLKCSTLRSEYASGINYELTIFAKSFISDVWLGFEYVSELLIIFAKCFTLDVLLGSRCAFGMFK